MKRKKIGKVIAGATLVSLLTTGIGGFVTQADEEHVNGIEISVEQDEVDESEEIEMSVSISDEEAYAEIEQLIEEYNSDTFLSIDEDGNIELIPLEDVETAEQSELEKIAWNPYSRSSVQYGVVVFNDRTSSGVTYYTDAVTGVVGYVNGLSGPDAAYLGMENGKVKMKISGVTALIDSSDVTIHDYDTYIASGYMTSSYKVTSGKLYHQITTNLTSAASTYMVGYKQSYMDDNTTYYSYDGHYFYKTYKLMLTDYMNGTYNNSINKSNPYYNYYQFLSHRTKSNFTATELNTYLNGKISNTTSKMIGMGSTFVSAQNTYGSNASLMFGLAIFESGYGNSTIAQDKNNLFGHGAVDSNPYYGANGYTSPAESINYHAEYFVSRQYTDALTDGRYFGAHLGNKESGMNVKYASDPYWGSKAASVSYMLEQVDTSSVKDYQKYTIGIVNGSTPIYSSPSNTILYYAKNKNYSATYNVPVVILGTEYYNGTKWYKIQSDMPVVSGRKSCIFSQIYNYENDYAYVKASLVSVAYEGTDSNSGSEVKLGDVNQDGVISALDYMIVKNYIMGTTSLSTNAISAADANGDGKVSALDYMMIKNHIMGTITLS